MIEKTTVVKNPYRQVIQQFNQDKNYKEKLQQRKKFNQEKFQIEEKWL